LRNVHETCGSPLALRLPHPPKSPAIEYPDVSKEENPAVEDKDNAASVPLLLKSDLVPLTVSIKECEYPVVLDFVQTNPPLVDKSMPLVMVCVEPLPV
jgi:hypothetical protein